MVLIVDDNRDLLEVLTEVVLTLGGVCVRTALSGLEALQLYPAVEPELVILDERLSDMGGSELLGRLRAANPAARRPALFVTGARASVRCQPGDVVLEKPVEMGRLLDAVRSLLPEPLAA